jgi:hypothetical protein
MACKYVDIAALSLSGSLIPSVPTKIALRWSPPLMTLVYHFENKPDELYYHEIPIDKKMLESDTTD